MIEYIEPAWRAPATVRAVSTTRRGGVSEGVWSRLNLAGHVGDRESDVAENRRRLRDALDLPDEPTWLQQVHGNRVVSAEGAGGCADACVSDEVGRVCVVLTADCLPVLFSNRAGTRVAAAHAGWRGLLSGVLESTLAAFDDPAGDLLAWFGPAIGAGAFEVGDEVRQQFLQARPDAEPHFRAGRRGRWFADLCGLAHQRLGSAGVGEISGGDHCTVSDPDRFFSYRRDGVTGRMATLIWLQPSREGALHDGE